MDITVSLQIKIQFDGDKRLSVGNFCDQRSKLLMLMAQRPILRRKERAKTT